MSDSATGASNVGAILDAYLRALEKGDAPPREELLKQHAQCAAELAAALDGLEFIHSALQELPRTAKEGGALPERQLLGDFRVVREVGRGGMAVVYEAEQVSLGRRVALKVLPFAAVLDSKQLQRFKNEALAAAHLHHPHIVPVYAVGCERGVHYYAMQLVDGQSLAAVIREMKSQEPAPEPKTPITSHGSNREPGYVRRAVALGMQAAEALDHAHQLGIVHRDVKPGNLLVDGTGELWITDFGLAHSIRDGDLTATGELLGTLRYMSPEQTRAKRTPMDHRTDVYSLGATLYELLTLEPAFPGDDPHSVMRDIAEREPVAPRRLNPALPVDLETIVQKAMSKDPSSRYATAQEMAEDLGRVLEDQPILARRPSVAVRASKWARRHRGFVAAAAVVLLLGVIALAVDNFRVGAEEKRTKEALDKANANLAIARGAIAYFLVDIGVSNMSDQPLPRLARKNLLEAALRFHEREFDDRDSISTRVTILHALHRYDDALGVIDKVPPGPLSPGWGPMQRGHMLWHLKRHDEALASLQRAIELDQRLAEAHSFRGCVLRDLGRNEEALAAIDLAIEIAPKSDPGSAPYHNYRGSVLAELGRPQDALAAYDRAIELDGKLPNPHCGRGAILSGRGRHDEALAAYDRAIAIDPSFAWAFSGRGTVLEALGRLDEAIRSHDRAVEIDPDDARAQVNRGIVLREQNRLDEAIEGYRKAIELEPRLVQAHDNLGLALADLDHLEEAEREILEALRLAPSDPHVHYNKGCLHLTRHEWQKAIDENLEALRLKHDLRPALVNLASALARTGAFDEAIERCNEAIALDKNDAEAWGGLGNVLRDQEDYDGAIKAYSQVIRIKPRYAVGRYCLGTALAHKGQHAQAIEAFHEALTLDEKFADAHYAMGNSLRALGRPDDAIAEFDAALSFREDADFWRSKGKAFGAKGDLASEIKAYEEAVRIRADYAEVYAELGRAWNDRGDHDGAIKACDEAIRLNSDLPEAHLNLGIAWCDKKNPDAGIKEFDEAIRLLEPGVPGDPKRRNDRETHDARSLALAYNGLGCAFADKKDSAKAIAAYHDAIRVDREVGPAHCNLANQLYGTGKDDEECEREYREAVRIEPGLAEAQLGLGRLLMAQRRYREALPYLRTGHEIGSRRPNWKVRSAEWIAQSERWVALEDRLPDLLSGAASPHDERERTDFALILYAKRRYREAAEFYAKALANDASLADDLKANHRYNAACTAVLAAANGAPDAASWRERGLDWLRADLEARKEMADLAAWLLHAKGDSDFKSVRDEVAALPAAERQKWTTLWSEVDDRITHPR